MTEDEPVSFDNLVKASQADLNILRGSATFAMSRGAKELFHTNFLSYVLEIDAKAEALACGRTVIEETQKKLLNLFFAPGHTFEVETWRELRSLDLVIAPKPAISAGSPAQLSLAGGTVLSSAKAPIETERICVVVVEAKLKSIPGEEQLRNYDNVLFKGIELDFEVPEQTKEVSWESLLVQIDEKNPKEGRIDAKGARCKNLGAISKDPTAKPEWSKRTRLGSIRACVERRLLTLAPLKTETQWEHISWDRYLECFPDEKAEGSGLHVDLMKDYGLSTRALIRIARKVIAAVDGLKTLKAMDDALMSKAFRDRRIHDLVGKLAFARLEGRLLSGLSPNAQGSFTVGSVEFHLVSYAFMTRATPGLTLAWHATSKLPSQGKPRLFATGIQIQRSEYRHFVSASHAEKRRDQPLKNWCELLDPDRSHWWETTIHVDAEDQGNTLALAANNEKKKARGKLDAVPDRFRKFGEEDFLYTFASIGHCSYEQLLHALDRSLCKLRDRLESPQSSKLMTEIHAFLTEPPKPRSAPATAGSEVS